MKYSNLIILIFSFLVVGMVYSQNANFPKIKPMSNLEIEALNYSEYVSAMDNYWEYTPHDFKGSGIKPYLRWRENSKYFLNEEGEMKTREEILASWENVRTQSRQLTNNSAWIPIGPFNYENISSYSPGQGRLNVCVVDPSNPNTLYVGAPDGGAWKSIDHGTSWENITDDLVIQGVSGIAVDYNNSDIIYISTGDEDGSNSLSQGVYKSTDGGSTWSSIGPYQPITTGEIYIHPTDSNILWLCTILGLYKSSDAGITWSLVEEGNVKELRLKPGDPNSINIVKQLYNGTVIMKSENAGNTFVNIKNYVGMGRVVIDVTAANPEVLYALVTEPNGYYVQLDKSIDSGETFTTKNSNTSLMQLNQAYYDLAIAVSETDENHIFIGYLDILKSTNGGTTLTPINSWSEPVDPRYTHADIHALLYKNGKIYCCSDGGIYISDDDAQSFVDKTNGMNIGQFYRIDVPHVANAMVSGGLQDNGGYALSNNQWYVYHGADGMDSAVDPSNTFVTYGFIQFGYFLYYFNSNPWILSGGFAAQNPDSFGNWITPLEFGDGGTLYAGYKNIFKLSEDAFVPAANYFLGIDNSNNISGIRVSPSSDYLVLATDGETLFLSDDNPLMTFTALDTPESEIRAFDFNRNDENIIYLAGQQGVYKSLDMGATWQNITYNFPIDDYITGIIHQRNSVNNTIYISTISGVYYTNDHMNNWELFANGLPTSVITDIEVNSVENHVIVSTFGRGIWRSPVQSESLKVEDTHSKNLDLAFYPNPTSAQLQLNTTIDEKVEVYIYNVEGKEVFSEVFSSWNPNSSITINELATGIYIINMVSPTHLITKKIIKE